MRIDQFEAPVDLEAGKYKTPAACPSLSLSASNNVLFFFFVYKSSIFKMHRGPFFVTLCALLAFCQAQVTW